MVKFDVPLVHIVLHQVLLLPQNALQDIRVLEVVRPQLKLRLVRPVKGGPIVTRLVQQIQTHAYYALLEPIAQLVQQFAHTVAVEQEIVHLAPLHVQIVGEDNIAPVLHLLEQPIVAVLEARHPHQLPPLAVAVSSQAKNIHAPLELIAATEPLHV